MPILADNLGVTFMSSGQLAADQARYEDALATGAGWNRWPLYWNEVEATPGAWYWPAYDRVVTADLAHGLHIDAILLGIPAAYRNNGVPDNLYAPVFDDGTDTPGPDKTLNPDNYWAAFVYRAVQRYKPGGELSARIPLLGDKLGIRVWEVWNEPDLIAFWAGGIKHYVRLLKTAYLAVKHADPGATVIFGGLAYIRPIDWLADSLALIADDPDHARYDWYFDAVAVHHYTYALGTWDVVKRVRQTLDDLDLAKPIWVNESGVPAWDDYPGPTWSQAGDAARDFRATQEEQAAFVVQSAAYAFAAGAERFFYHQLYDDCGNQPAGTDFAPHNGELCATDELCFGDAHGLYRNPPDALCFRRHAHPRTARPARQTFQVLAKVFGAGPVELVAHEQRGADERQTWITFYQPQTGSRILVLWNRGGEDVTVTVPAHAGTATLYDIRGNAGAIYATAGGVYPPLVLEAATNQAVPGLPDGEQYAIGGPPYIVVEVGAP
ncbi:MAG: hypothetical protein JXB47_00875 [Anaerolineae bacterium]|nr:hypothetical protein [Anaerolineae bacterium]